MKRRMLAFAGALLALAMVAQVATAQTKWAQGIKIVFFPGGPQGGVFAVNVYNGAKQAEYDLGVKVNYVWSNWDPQQMIQQFQERAPRQCGRCTSASTTSVVAGPTGMSPMENPMLLPEFTFDGITNATW